MRFHILGVPHTVTNREYVACAYTQKVLKFGKMMKERGHEIIHYGHEDSRLICDEHVTVITNDDFIKSYGTHDWRNNFFKFDNGDHAYSVFYNNAIREIGKRKQPNDFLLAFWGSGHYPICEAHDDMIVVEPGIGYPEGHFARWRVYESYNLMSAIDGYKKVAQCLQDWYHVVIPNYFDIKDFTYSNNKDDYFLCLGRVSKAKGVHIAVEMTKQLGKKLIVAGQGDFEKELGFSKPDHVEVVGYANGYKRERLMANAKGLIIASTYNEPFGGVQIEAMLSGTPVISTDWGAFAEYNIHGYTGYRCRTFQDFIEAGRNIESIDSYNCRKWAENFSLNSIGIRYEKYFQDVLNVFDGKGWYSEKSGNLNALLMELPT